jgi:hypothetical protein
LLRGLPPDSSETCVTEYLPILHADSINVQRGLRVRAIQAASSPIASTAAATMLTMTSSTAIKTR